jgi:UDP-N-acetyl-D-mannosaminuronic acid dehydrogenase
LIYAARRVNDAQPQFALDLVKKAVGPLKGKKIAALGMAFKPDVDDMRESPAVEVIHLLNAEGAIVKAFDPLKPDVDLPDITVVPQLAATLKDADAVVLLVRHTELMAITPVELVKLTPARILVDTVNGWSGMDWKTAGFKVHTLGADA